MDRFPSLVSWRTEIPRPPSSTSSSSFSLASEDYKDSISSESALSEATASWEESDTDSVAPESSWDGEAEAEISTSSCSYHQLQQKLEQANALIQLQEERSAQQELRIAELEGLLQRSLSAAARREALYAEIARKILRVIHIRIINGLVLPLRALARFKWPDYLSLVSLAYDPATPTAHPAGHISHLTLEVFSALDAPLSFLASRCLTIIDKHDRIPRKKSEKKPVATYEEFVAFVDNLRAEVRWTKEERDLVLWQCGEAFLRC